MGFDVRSTYHTTLQSIPGHMVFGCDMILNTPFIADWEAIRLRNQKIIDKDNQLENKNRKPHIYIIRDKVLVRAKKSNKYEDPHVGPYPMTQVWTNVNATIRKGRHTTEHKHYMDQTLSQIIIECKRSRDLQLGRRVKKVGMTLT